MIVRRFPIIVSVILVLILAAGLVRLFQLRFQEGDIYPAYSTLRSDPLGTRALYQALAEMPGFEAERHHRSWRWLPSPEDRTLFFLGADPGLVERLERGRDEDGRDGSLLLDWVDRGGRCVIALRPPMAGGRDSSRESENGENAGDGTGGAPDEGSRAENGERFFPGIRFDREHAFRSDAESSWEEAGTKTGLFTWRSGVYFDLEAVRNDWRVVLEGGGRPVGIRRDYGDGEFAMIADTFPFSNEAMLRERRTDFLAFALGGRRNAVFEESHLGVIDTTGLAMLARRYDFEGVFLAALFLAFIFLWRSAYTLLPRRNEASGSGGTVAGKGAAESLQLLFQRGGNARELLDAGIRDWRRSSHFLGLPEWKRREVAAFLNSNPSAGESPSETYEAIRKLVEKKRP